MDVVIVIAAMIIFLILMLALRVPLYITLAIIPIITAILYGGLGLLGDAITSALKSRTTWGLVLNVSVVAWLVSLYRQLNIVNRLGNELSKFFKNDTLAITLVPGVIGLLLVPGGALMSAPIVDSLGERTKMPKVKRNFVNIWYRHVLIYVFPLSSLLLITASIFSVSLFDIVKAQIPVAIFMFLLGLPIIGIKTSSNHEKADAISLLKDFSPILTSVVLAIALYPIDRVFPVERFSVTLATLIGIIVFAAVERSSMKTVLSALKDKKVLEIAVISLEIMIFRTIFEFMDLNALTDTIMGIGIRPELFGIILPLLFSFISGTSSAGIAISSPIISSIIGNSYGIANLVYAAAFLGYLGSPLHLCYVYSSEYFNVSMRETYKYMVPSILMTLIVVWLLYNFFWA